MADVSETHAAGSSSVVREAAGAEDRVLTAPNLITAARLALLGWSLAELFGSNARIEAAILLAIAGSTDFLDGYVARRFNRISNLGKLIDPMVDVVVLMSSIVGVAIYRGAPWWFAGLVLARETHMIVTGLVLKRMGARRVDVLYLGKCATFGLMTAFPLLLLGDGPGTAAHFVRVIGWVVGIPSLALSIVVVFLYVPVARAALDAGRADRAAHAASAT